MKILYIHQYFVTPREPGGTRSYWFAKELISQGHQVTILTSSSKQELFIERKNIDGIDVVYVRNRYDNNMGISSRLWSFFKFMIYSTWIGLRQKNIDMVFATSTPLSVGIPALFIKWFKGTKYIFEVRDLWPEVPIQMGAIKNKLVIKLLSGFERLIYKRASHVIALSPGMEEGVIKQGISKEKVTVIPNMAKKEEFYSRPLNYELSEKMGLSANSFKVVHFGAMGNANGLVYVIETANILKGMTTRRNIEIVFLGAGQTEPGLKKLCEDYALNNVRFLGAHPLNLVSEIVNVCHCSLVSFSDIPILSTNSPNKFFDSLSAAKPVIVNSRGWTKDIVETYNCGVFVDPQNPASLANMLVKMSENDTWIREMGANSRKIAEELYDKTILTKQFVRVLEDRIQ